MTIVKKLYNFSEKVLPDFLKIQYMLRMVYIYSLWRLYIISKKTNLKKLKEISHCLRKSDKLFILGSGASINNLSLVEWEYIKKYDSVGFNFWLVHEFVPNFYVYEESYITERNEIFYQILNMKKEQYKNTPFLIKDVELKYTKLLNIPNDIKHNFYLASCLFLQGSSLKKQYFNRILLEVDKFLQKKNKNNIQFSFGRKASLSYLVFLAYLLGYKEIILCGVDLNNTDYFFDHDFYVNSLKPINAKGAKHATNQINNSSDLDMTIAEILHGINTTLLEPKGIKLMVSNPNSALVSVMEVYDFNH